MLASVSLLRVSNLAEAKHRGKAKLFRGGLDGEAEPGASLLVSASLLRVSNLAKAKHRGKAELFRGGLDGPVEKPI